MSTQQVTGSQTLETGNELRSYLEHRAVADAAYVSGAVEIALCVQHQGCKQPSPVSPSRKAVQHDELSGVAELERDPAATIECLARGTASAALIGRAIEVAGRVTDQARKGICPAGCRP